MIVTGHSRIYFRDDLWKLNTGPIGYVISTNFHLVTPAGSTSIKSAEGRARYGPYVDQRLQPIENNLIGTVLVTGSYDLTFLLDLRSLTNPYEYQSIDFELRIKTADGGKATKRIKLQAGK